MRDLRELYLHISNLSGPVPYVPIPVRDWERIRVECQRYCEAHDEHFTCDPNIPTPNFIVLGVPVLAAGSA